MPPVDHIEGHPRGPPLQERGEVVGEDVCLAGARGGDDEDAPLPTGHFLPRPPDYLLLVRAKLNHGQTTGARFAFSSRAMASFK